MQIYASGQVGVQNRFSVESDKIDLISNKKLTTKNHTQEKNA